MGTPNWLAVPRFVKWESEKSLALLPHGCRLLSMGAMYRIPWMLKTYQTMGKAGMPPTSIAAMAFPRPGSTRARARARASAEGIPSGANSLCTREEVMWSPWGLYGKVWQGKADLIHVQLRKAICWSSSLMGLCRLKGWVKLTHVIVGDSESFGSYFQEPGICTISELEEKCPTSILRLVISVWWPLLEPAQAWGAHTHAKLTTRQVRSGYGLTLPSVMQGLKLYPNS